MGDHIFPEVLSETIFSIRAYRLFHLIPTVRGKYDVFQTSFTADFFENLEGPD
jgi:hypothetical protein